MENKPKIKNLKKNSDFLELRKKGLRINPSEWLQIQYLKSNDEVLFIGVTTGRKVGTAVIRNRLKRWSREFFRKNLSQLTVAGRLNVVFKPRQSQFYKELKHEDLDRLLEKACERIRTPR